MTFTTSVVIHLFRRRRVSMYWMGILSKNCWDSSCWCYYPKLIKKMRHPWKRFRAWTYWVLLSWWRKLNYSFEILLFSTKFWIRGIVYQSKLHFVIFQQDGRSIAYGENFQKTVRDCYDSNPEQLVAIGANCLAPRLIENLFKGINNGRKNPIPLIVYPNSGESYNVEQGYDFQWQ